MASGTPISRQVSNFNLPFFYQGRGSEGYSLAIPDAVFFQPGGFDTQSYIVSQNRLRDARFLMNRTFQDRRQIRFGVKYLF